MAVTGEGVRKIVKTSLESTEPDYDKQIYDLTQLIEISRSLCSTLDLNTLIESILYISMAQMRVVSAGVFILNSIQSTYYKLEENYSGFEKNPSLEYIIPNTAPIINVLSEKKTTFTMQELEDRLPKDKDVFLLNTLDPSLVVPLIVKNRLIGILILGERIRLDSADNVEYTDYEKNEIYTIASLAAVAINNASLVEISSTDMMTKLKLKYYFFNMLTDSLDMACSQCQSLGVIMFDIDFFKKINDTYGHACGDYVLQKVAHIIKDSIRSNDLASRYGGEEFTVMLTNTGKKEAIAVAERIRKNIENTDFYFHDQHMHVTISGGVSVFSPDNNPVGAAKVLVDQADQALYISKRNGKNRISFAEPAVLAAAAISGKLNEPDI